MDLGELEEYEEYDSQEEKRRSGPVVLGEEAKKSKRARSRSVTVKKKAPEEVAVLAEGAGVATPAPAKKVKTKNTYDCRGDPNPAVALAALALKYKDQREFFKAKAHSFTVACVATLLERARRFGRNTSRHSDTQLPWLSGEKCLASSTCCPIRSR
jgi:hypothetical protein